MTLRSKLILTHTAVVVLAVVLVVAVATRSINRYFAELANAQAQAVAIDIAGPLGACYEQNGGWPRPVRRCLTQDSDLRQAMLARPASRRVLIADPDGRIVFDSAEKRRGERLTAAELGRSVPIVAGGRTVAVVVALPNTGQYGAAEDRFLVVVRRSVLVAGIAAGLVALLIGGLLAQGVTRPLRALTAAAQRLAAGDSGAQVAPLASGDEVGDLSQAFNTMSAELRRSEEARRQMVADIAHELRTPLSVLRLELESIEDGVTQATPAVVGSLNEEVGLLGRLVDDLRTLSLADADQLSLDIAPVAVDEVIERVVGRMQASAREKGIALVAHAPAPGVFVSADPARLQQVIGNLLSNALRYTPAGGQVEIAARPNGGEVILAVRDSGPGFSAAEAAAIFERFYRTDKARARDTGGSGLGLAIVRGLVQAMRGRVWATSQPGAGTIFYVALPVASS
jgi:signal transduction histidine kinase